MDARTTDMLQEMLQITITELAKRLREAPESFSNNALTQVTKMVRRLLGAEEETTPRLQSTATGGGAQAAPLNRAQRRALEKRK